MLKSLAPLISNTPLWVFFLFGFLLYRGIQGLKPRVLPWKRVLILPVLLLFLSGLLIFRLFPIPLDFLALYFLCSLIGFGVGWLWMRKQKLKFDHKANLIERPGSPFTLVLLMTLFFTKYYFNYSLALDPSLKVKTSFIAQQLVISGLSFGLLFARVFNYFIKRKRSEHIPLFHNK